MTHNDGGLEKATIEFPKPLTLEQTEDLLDYFADEIPANLNTFTGAHCQRYHDPAASGEGITRDRGTVAISGQIRTVEAPFLFDHFETVTYSDNFRLIGAIRFSPILGYSYDEQPDHAKQLWEVIRDKVQDYFTERVP